MRFGLWALAFVPLASAASDACEDRTALVDGQQVAWYDRDGSQYTCQYYAEEGLCEEYGDAYRNTFTAREACCACGGGVAQAPVAQPQLECSDRGIAAGADVAAWHDARGTRFSCAWYEASPSRCRWYGDAHVNVMTARDACCVCGGGAGGVGAAVDLAVAVNAAEQRTEAYYAPAHPEGMLFVRRAATYTFHVRTASPEELTVSLHADAEAYPRHMYSVAVAPAGDDAATVAVTYAADAALGEYTLRVVHATQASAAVSVRVAVLVNAEAHNDAAYLSSASDVDEYVHATEGVVYVGQSDNVGGVVYKFGQHEWVAVAVALRSLRRMPVMERGELALVARHLTFAVGEDVCYGKWGGGSYTTGRPAGGYRCNPRSGAPCVDPDAWSDMNELLGLHVSLGYRRVQYCQCFIYAAVLNTLGRALGIPTRAMTMFQSAHDTERNRAIDEFYTEDAATGALDPVEGHGLTADSVWNFHVWNEMWFARKDIDCKGMRRRAGCADGWQAVDSTPQETSAGGSAVAGSVYQMGPAAVALVKKNLHPVCDIDALRGVRPDPRMHEVYGCYDHEFVVSEANANVNLWVTDAASPTGWRLYDAYQTNPWGMHEATLGKLAATKRPGPISAACHLSEDHVDHDCSGDMLDITASYKRPEPSGPGTPLLPSCAEPDSDRARCSGPAFQFDASKAVRTAETAAVRPPAAVAFAPAGTAARGMVVDAAGHPQAAFTAEIAFRAEADVAVVCTFTVVPVDYRGVAVGGTVWREVVPVAARAGQDAVCTSRVTRAAYVNVDEHAYALKMVATARADTGDLAVREAQRVICRPRAGADLNAESIACRGHRGIWRRSN
eukprot:TRINITY_DN1010_c0_g1_i3.p1 TRINITY_DN1010_c0_g1~~TRINITY_DN1010_c0_g1_i3.p1  ORF type:complete len:841 (+),score=254.58 TRINITY_DN1010_c0_g1_i3:55-2577(+)